MTNLNTYQTGQKGEQFVCDRLAEQKYKILARNVREKFAEIDIVALDTRVNTIAFIEVRTRKNGRLGHPAETITQKKQRQIRRVAEAYLSKNKIVNTAIRFDVATIIWDEMKFEYFENAF